MLGTIKAVKGVRARDLEEEADREDDPEAVKDLVLPGLLLNWSTRVLETLAQMTSSLF